MKIQLDNIGLLMVKWFTMAAHAELAERSVKAANPRNPAKIAAVSKGPT